MIEREVNAPQDHHYFLSTFVVHWCASAIVNALDNAKASVVVPIRSRPGRLRRRRGCQEARSARAGDLEYRRASNQIWLGRTHKMKRGFDSLHPLQPNKTKQNQVFRLRKWV